MSILSISKIMLKNITIEGNNKWNNTVQEGIDIPSSIPNNLNELEQEVVTTETNNTLKTLATEILSKIDKDKDPYEKDPILREIGEKLEKKEYIQAFFSLIQGLIKGFWLSAKSGFKH